jgi:hypothetical protein
MVGALHFLAMFYENVYFLCKNVYFANVSLFFTGTNIHCLSFDSTNEFADIERILAPVYATHDVFVCGCHKKYAKSNIKLMLGSDPSKYTIDHDMLTSQNYDFIENFYKDVGLNLTHFYEYFQMPATPESAALYKSASSYYIIFVQLKASDGRRLNIANLLKRKDDPGVLLLCNDENLYPPESDKHALCNEFVRQPIVHYVDTVQQCDEIYLIDSCFIGLVLPYLKTNRLKAKTVRIILRNVADQVVL